MFTDTRRPARLPGILALLLACVWLQPAAQAQPQPMDRIVAIVDDDVVLASEYQQRLKVITENIKKQGIESPPDEVLARQVLDRLILERIQMQMADRAGVRIGDAELNEALANMARGNGMDLEQFRANLEATGESYNHVREQVRQEMLLSRVQQGNVRSRVQITEKEVDDYLASEEGQKRTAPVFHIAHLLLPLPTDASQAQENEARVWFETLRERLAAPGAFEKFMAAPEKGPYAITGGDLGYRQEDDLPSIFHDTVPKLEAGAISSPLRSPSGLHLVKLLEKRGGGGQMTQQTLVRHILLKPSEIRTPEQTREFAEQLRQRILGGEDFAKLARQYSEDIGSAREGGSLDWTNPGQMVPVFEQVMEQTAAGELSAPFQSEYGWHILQVQDRRVEDLSDEMRRNQARNIIFSQRYEEELNTWFQKIRDEAFVEIKI